MSLDKQDIEKEIENLEIKEKENKEESELSSRSAKNTSIQTPLPKDRNDKTEGTKSALGMTAKNSHTEDLELSCNNPSVSPSPHILKPIIKHSSKKSLSAFSSKLNNIECKFEDPIIVSTDSLSHKFNKIRQKMMKRSPGPRIKLEMNKVEL